MDIQYINMAMESEKKYHFLHATKKTSREINQNPELFAAEQSAKMFNQEAVSVMSTCFVDAPKSIVTKTLSSHMGHEIVKSDPMPQAQGRLEAVKQTVKSFKWKKLSSEDQKILSDLKKLLKNEARISQASEKQGRAGSYFKHHSWSPETKTEKQSIPPGRSRSV